MPRLPNSSTGPASQLDWIDAFAKISPATCSAYSVVLDPTCAESKTTIESFTRGGSCPTIAVDSRLNKKLVLQRVLAPIAHSVSAKVPEVRSCLHTPDGIRLQSDCYFICH